jgi:hypothetical protein
MAVCPHCGRKLRLADWRPECPGCGVNLIYYDSNRRLLDESEKAEKEHALFQPRIDRAKAAYAGSKLAILRIVLTLLPAAALFLPLLRTAEGGVNVIGVYKKLNEAGIGAVLGKAMKDPVCLAAALLLVSAVMIIVSIALITMSLGRHGRIRVILTYGFMLLCAAGAVCLAGVNSVRLGEIFSESGIAAPLGVGAILYAALFLVLFAYNLFLLKKGIPVKYTPCLIGGLPSEEYFRCVGAGMSKSDIQRKMLLALADLREAQEIALAKERGDNA